MNEEVKELLDKRTEIAAELEDLDIPWDVLSYADTEWSLTPDNTLYIFYEISGDGLDSPERGVAEEFYNVSLGRKEHLEVALVDTENGLILLDLELEDRSLWE